MAETFSAYSDYAAAYTEEARACADEYIRKISPEKALPDGENGRIIATGASPYHLDHGLGNPNNHSGPGTGGFTSLLFWDYYDYTRDGEYLEKSRIRIFAICRAVCFSLLRSGTGNTLPRFRLRRSSREVTGNIMLPSDVLLTSR